MKRILSANDAKLRQKKMKISSVHQACSHQKAITPPETLSVVCRSENLRNLRMTTNRNGLSRFL